MAATLGHSPFYETIHLPANFQNLQDFPYFKSWKFCLLTAHFRVNNKIKKDKYEELRPLTSPGCRGLTYFETIWTKFLLSRSYLLSIKHQVQKPYFLKWSFYLFWDDVVQNNSCLLNRNCLQLMITLHLMKKKTKTKTKTKQIRQFWTFSEFAQRKILWKKIIAVIDATYAVAKRKTEKKIKACTGLEPLTSARPVRRSTNWANKPTGSRSIQQNSSPHSSCLWFSYIHNFKNNSVKSTKVILISTILTWVGR